MKPNSETKFNSIDLDSKKKNYYEEFSDQDWKIIHYCFNKRLFSSGALAIFTVGLIAAFIALMMLKNAKPGFHIPLFISILLFLISLPYFTYLPSSLLLIIGLFDKIAGAVFYIIGFPLAIVSMAWLVTDMIAARIWNAGTWIFKHSKLQDSLNKEIAKYKKEGYKLVYNGLLPNNRLGFWGAESDEGNFWAIEKLNGKIKLTCSKENFNPIIVDNIQAKNANLILPKKIKDVEIKKKLVPYPVEHILIWDVKNNEGEEIKLHLVLGYLAARFFADNFAFGREDVKKTSGKTSLLAIYSCLFILIGPLGLTLGIISLIQINRSKNKLKGKLFSWVGIIAGGFFTLMIILLNLAQ